MKKDLSPVYDLIRADGSIVINKNLCHAIGREETIVYSELLSRYNYFNIREELDEEGFFYNTVDDFELATTLNGKEQKKAIDKLTKLGLIQTKLKGVPAKRYFKIIDDLPMLLAYIEHGKKNMELIIEKQKKEKERLAKRKEEAKQMKESQQTGNFGSTSTSNNDEQIQLNVPVNNTNPIIPIHNTKKEGCEEIMEGTKPSGVSTTYVSSIPFYDYVGKLISSFADIPKSLKYEIYESIIYYCSKYEEEFGIEHIRYKTSTLKIVIKRLYDLYTVGILDEQRDIMVGDDLTLDDFKTMADKNFKVQFNGKGGRRMSFTLLSFLNDNVLIHRFYEELY